MFSTLARRTQSPRRSLVSLDQIGPQANQQCAKKFPLTPRRLQESLDFETPDDLDAPTFGAPSGTSLSRPRRGLGQGQDVDWPIPKCRS